MQKKRSKLTMDWRLRLRLLASGISASRKSRGTLRVNEVLKAHRSSIIIPIFEGNDFDVYNGRRYIRIKVLPERIGHRFGEFAATSAWALNSSKKVETVQKDKKKK